MKKKKNNYPVTAVLFNNYKNLWIKLTIAWIFSIKNRQHRTRVVGLISKEICIHVRITFCEKSARWVSAATAQLTTLKILCRRRRRHSRKVHFGHALLCCDIAMTHIFESFDLHRSAARCRHFVWAHNMRRDDATYRIICCLCKCNE